MAVILKDQEGKVVAALKDGVWRAPSRVLADRLNADWPLSAIEEVTGTFEYVPDVEYRVAWEAAKDLKESLDLDLVVEKAGPPSRDPPGTVY